MLHSVLGPQGDGLQGLTGGRHGTLGGLPTYSGKQKQTGTLPTTLQPELGPQVLGSQS